MEELQARHKKEHKDLQGKITQKKKQANKKTRKGVNDECERLETELKERQAGEVAAVNGQPPEDALQDLTINGHASADDEDKTDGAPQPSVSEHSEPAQPEPPAATTTTKKPNRQRARLARRQAEQEASTARAADEAQNLPDMKQQERERMLSYMAERGLVEKEIRADGHCLYSALADQLEQKRIPLMPGLEELVGEQGYKLVRDKAAEYIEGHRGDFEPFLEEGFEEYVRKIRETGEWGGQLELLALAKGFGVDIHVLQDFGRVERIEGHGEGEGEVDRELWLGYYKHGFGLGEHYNSLRKAEGA